MKKPRAIRSWIAAAVVIPVTVFTGAASCGSSKPSAQAAGNHIANTEYAKFNALVPYPFANSDPSDPLERKNLSRRLVAYNSKGDTNYVYLFDFAGHVIGYYVITGKVSSTSSAMTSTQVNVSCGSNGDDCTDDAIGDDGSYGPEEGGLMGVFFFTTTGTLVETDQPFLVSNTPIPTYSHVPQLDAPASK